MPRSAPESSAITQTNKVVRPLRGRLNLTPAHHTHSVKLFERNLAVSILVEPREDLLRLRVLQGDLKVEEQIAELVTVDDLVSESAMFASGEQ